MGLEFLQHFQAGKSAARGRSVPWTRDAVGTRRGRTGSATQEQCAEERGLEPAHFLNDSSQ